ncbi:erythromycin esterase family protein [Nonomuraea sp. NPDC050404]|uniref:erythromycin esterase family protein n=1 Tax=Nonomuraea sp. NPDC050404 TaxID=3155783 RepID=UPI0033EACB0D
MSTTSRTFADRLRDHAVTLTHVDPAAPQDDLEPLRTLIGDARVVAIGESSHFITEFALMRHRILRFLVQRCGFTALAYEFGFSEGLTLNSWVHGAGTKEDLARYHDVALPVGLAEPLRWLREHNETPDRQADFLGVDISEGGGSLLPALQPVHDYLRQVDAETARLAERAIETAALFADASGAGAVPKWARLGSAQQDALSAVLMRLLLRFHSMKPVYVSRGGHLEYDIALRRLEAACHGEYSMRAMADLFAAKGLPGDTSAREIYMAGSVLWHLRHSAPGTRIVLAAHNAHIQKTPIAYGGRLTTLPMGQHLHDLLGADYFALGLTSTTGQTAEMSLDENARFGFTVHPTDLQPPEEGSIEAAFGDAGLGLSLADLSPASPNPQSPPDRIRLQGSYLHTPVLEAFDAVLNIPDTTVEVLHDY